jgi:hypothetical protein
MTPVPFEQELFGPAPNRTPRLAVFADAILVRFRKITAAMLLPYNLAEFAVRLSANYNLGCCPARRRCL